MMLRFSFVLFACALLAPTVRAADVSFARDIAPIFVQRCQSCHNAQLRKGAYGLHTFESLIQAGTSGEAPLVPGNPGASALFKLLIENDADARMPKKDDPLSKAQIALVEQWIKAGAPFDGTSKKDRLTSYLPPRPPVKPPEEYRVPMPVLALQFSPDGERIYAGGINELTVWEAATGKLVQRIPGLPQRIQALAFSPDGKTLVVGGGSPGEYGEVNRVDVTTGKVTSVGTFEDIVLGVAVSVDGKFIAAGGADNTLRSYDAATGKMMWRSEQHAEWVTSVAFSPYQFAEEILANKGAPAFLKFNEDELKSGEHPCLEWAFADRWILREANWELAAKGNTVETLTYKFASGIGGAHYKVEKTVYTAQQAQEKNPEVVKYLLAKHADWGAKTRHQYFVFSSSKDMRVGVTEGLSGKLFVAYMGHRKEYGKGVGLNKVYAVVPQADSRDVVSAGEGVIHGWDPIAARDEGGTASDGGETRFSQEKTTHYIDHEIRGQINRIVLQDGHLFVAGTDGRVQQLEYATAKSIQILPGSGDDAYALSVNAAQKRVAVAGFNGVVMVWNSETGKELCNFLAAPGCKIQVASSDAVPIPEGVPYQSLTKAKKK